MTARSLAIVMVVALAGASARLDAQLITQPTALRYGLNRAWYNQIPIDTSHGKFAHWTLHKDLLLTQTSQGLVTAIDAETGGTRWTVRLANKEGSPHSAPAANNTAVAAVNGNTLHVFERTTGRVLWERKLPTTVNSGLVMNETRVFFAMSNGWLASYNLEDPAKGEWHYAAKGGTFTRPILTRESVAWANDKGLLTASQFDSSKLTFQFETDDGLAGGGLGYQPPFIFMGLKDDNIYAIGSRRGRKLGQVIWRFYTGGSINHPPAAVGDHVYVSTSEEGMYCLKIGTIQDSAEARKKGAAAEAPADGGGGVLERSGGAPVWWQSRATQFLSASATRVYASDLAGRLLILDRKSGAILGSLLIPDLTRRMANVQNDRIFLANDAGFIQQLHERDLEKPMVHLWPDEAEAAPKREIKKGEAVGGEEKKDDAKEEAKKAEEEKAEK